VLKPEKQRGMVLVRSFFVRKASEAIDTKISRTVPMIRRGSSADKMKWRLGDGPSEVENARLKLRF
jgi:hypothetical protein